MPIKRGGQPRSNAGKFTPEGQGATQRGGRLRTPKGNTRPTQTARLPKFEAPGAVSSTGQSKAPQGSRFSIGSFVESAVRSTLGRYAPQLAAGYAVLEPKPVADGTLTAARERGDYKPSQNMRGADEGLTRAESFDKAFASARNAGKSEFKWRGRSYNTKLKGE